MSSLPSFGDASCDTQALLGRLRSFCFPGGEDAARQVQGIRDTQRGEIRMSPEARWIPFTANEFIDASRSGFRWDARLSGGIGSVVVTDAYEKAHGRLTVKAAGVVPLKKIVGPDVDRGELQRYLSAIILCPPIVLNHPSLEWKAVGRLTLQVRDREDPTGATVDLEISEEGCPLACRAERPRLVGKQAILTPWSATCSEFRDWAGLRVPARLEVSWHLPDGAFTYFRGELTSFAVLR